MTAGSIRDQDVESVGRLRVVFVDDGSTDDTAAIVEQHCDGGPFVLLRQPANTGKGGQCGQVWTMQSSTGIQQQACANSFENFSLEFDKRSQRAITREMRRGATRTSASTCSTTTSSEERSPARCPQGCPLGALEEPREILTSLQRTTLALIEKTNKPLYRAYLLKEQLRLVFQLPFAKAVKALDRWLSWARRCRLQPFVRLARSVAYYRDDIEAALRHRLSNALVESTNTKIRLITRRSFGFYSPAPLIALAMLSLGGLMPTPARPWIAPTDMAVEPEILSHSVLPDFLGMVLRCSN